jgi:hypothetical protein
MQMLRASGGSTEEKFVSITWQWCTFVARKYKERDEFRYCSETTVRDLMLSGF